MVERQAIELLALNFSSTTFACRRLAQGLSRSLPVFSNFFREYLNPVIKEDHWAQFVDGIGRAANFPQQLIEAIRATF